VPQKQLLPWIAANAYDILIFLTGQRCGMELEGVVCNGVIVPDDATVLPEGTRVRISPAPADKAKSFGERYAQFKGSVPGLPADLARQHDHYRLGKPKR
jgi:hypothetical protein